MTDYDVIVIGGGHAGIEACLACARLNKKTLLVTGDFSKVGHMPCNPSIGGPAKGIVVREIDALGGQMAKTADQTALQMKMLNISKGPAVRALRFQVDTEAYPKLMQDIIKSQSNLDVEEALVDRLIVEAGYYKAVVLEDKRVISSKEVILTTGTYMKAKIMAGKDFAYQGPSGQRASMGLSDSLRAMGIKTFRLKTGTPARIKRESIDFSKAIIQPGDQELRHFSYEKQKPYLDIKDQLPCYLIYTQPETHKLIYKHMQESSMYSGLVEGIGPRYCPSIETKLERFKDKDRHQIFLEPESLQTNSIYIQGFSTSMPIDIQDQMLRTLTPLKNCEVIRYAYAIEYDAVIPTQIKKSLENKIVQNLYTAGQINGTSGYEEAAGQGLIAGINAARKIDNKEPIILGRDEAYIGVLIDDLVTKGTNEPYRLLTSRAEFRLLLRHDNADSRLTEIGYQVGLISKERYNKFLVKEKFMKQEVAKFKKTRIYPDKETNTKLASLNIQAITEPITLYQLLKRPGVDYYQLKSIVNESLDVDPEWASSIELHIKYEGYINKAKKQASDMKKTENIKIRDDVDYFQIHNLAYEAKEKLSLVKPMTLGQASRIPGITPSDVQILLAFLRGR